MDPRTCLCAIYHEDIMHFQTLLKNTPRSWHSVQATSLHQQHFTLFILMIENVMIDDSEINCYWTLQNNSSKPNSLEKLVETWYCQNLVKTLA